jgi:amino acid adenylation domain-containing protein
MHVSIYDFFEQTARENEDKTAIIDNNQSFSFSQLEADCHNLACKIVEKSYEVNVVIGVLLKKSYPLVVSNLAITASGCAYMNLDYKSPPERLRSIIENVNPTIIITDSEGAKSLRNIFDNLIPGIILYDENEHSLADIVSIDDLRKRREKIIDTDPYCLINTSGSTGTPKSVILNHKSFVDFLNWSVLEFDFNGSEIMGSLSPPIFDIYSFELCLLSFQASTICLIDDKLSPFPAKILEIVEEHKVNFIFWVPTIMVNIVNLGLLDKFSLENLKTVWFAGEVFPTAYFNKWFDQLPNTKFVNLYGPIEITLDCSYHVINDRIPDDQPIPIGRRCKNTDLIVLNDDGTETKEGDIGELCVRGTSLAMGYYNNPEATKKAFIINPLNKKYPEIIYKTGDLVSRSDELYYFKGRADTLVKHLGYRIELAEIEHSISSNIKEVRNVCVIYVAEKKEIIAYCELKSHLTIKDFRIRLRNVLPSYMIPAKLVEVEKMSMNTNGKIDRLVYKRLSQE